MNRGELLAVLADRAHLPRSTASAVLDALVEIICEAVADGDRRVAVSGFFTVEVGSQAASGARGLKGSRSTRSPTVVVVRARAGSKLQAAVRSP